MIWIAIISWVLGSLMTMKMDSMFVGNPTWKNGGWIDIFISIFVWPIIAVLHLTTKHVCDNGKWRDEPLTEEDYNY